VASDSNYTAPSSKTCSVTVDMPSATLGDNTPATIQAAARAGVAPNYWSVGDKIGIKINGTFGGLTVNDTYYAVIIGFNHNSGIEGGNSIHFQFGKNSSGKDIAFIGSGGGTSFGDAFNMCTQNLNSYGWSRSYMRVTVCPAFLNCMPTGWQSVIASCTKYSDNSYDPCLNSADGVTSTSDKIWLLAEFEVFGSRTSANGAEQNYQKQYDYYKNGNSKVRYKHGATSDNCDWWVRSACSSSTDSSANSRNCFCAVNTYGKASIREALTSHGFSPCFKVA